MNRNLYLTAYTIRQISTSLLTVLLLTGISLRLPAQYILNGSATTFTGVNCFQLTPAALTQSGSVWYQNTVSLANSFELEFDIFLGCNDGGADGMAFVLQPISTSLGTGGGGLGYLGITPSFVLEFDTWQNTSEGDPLWDHMALQSNGSTSHLGVNNLVPPVNILASGANAEDCNYHSLRIVWRADSLRFRAYVDCNQRLTWTGNIAALFFNNNPNVFWGFTAATGGASNIHRVCVNNVQFFQPMTDTLICQGQSAQLTASPGQSYSWSPATGLSSTTIGNPIANPATTTTYIVSITDACGIIKYDTVEVGVIPDTLSLDLPAQLQLCNGGSLTLGPPAAPGISYAWSTGATTSQITLNQPGTYSLTLSNSCFSVTDSVVVLPPYTASVAVTPPICSNSPTGTAILTFNGTPPYSVGWATLTGTVLQAGLVLSGTDTLTGLAPGTYVAGVQDGIGCADTVFFTVLPGPDMSLAALSLLEPDCFGGTNGAITLSASGGTGPYMYGLNVPPTTTNPVFGGLGAGTYTFLAQDVNLCTAAVTVTLGGPQVLVPQLSGQLNLGCAGDNTALITLGATGGRPPYQFAFDGGAFAPVTQYDSVPSGLYTIIVRDDSGCTAQGTLTVTEPSPTALAVISVTDIRCAGEAAGAFSLTASGGTMPYQFSLDSLNFQPNNTFSGLTAGVYQAWMWDANRCPARVNVTVREPAPLVLSASLLSSPACFGDQTGQIQLAATGGTPGYNFAVGTLPAQLSGLFGQLGAGSYLPVVTDAAGCRDTLPAVLITQPTLLTANATAVDVSCFGRMDGTVTVTAAGGVAPYQYNWDGLPGQTGNFTSRLGAGGYRIFVADANGCQTSATTLIREPDRLILLPVSVADAFCELPNGAISVAAQGGTPAYQYLWRQLPGFDQPSTSQLNSGTYQIVLTDARGCQDSLRLVVEDIPAPVAQFAADPDLSVPVVRARAIFQMINQSRNAIAYEWDFGDGSPVSFEPAPQHKFHTPGEYTIRLRAWNETLACPDDTTITVLVLADGDLWAPTGFSPNGDQVNDVFSLQGSGIESLELVLFNRWGEEVVRFTQVTDTWDGRLPGGADAPEGVYTYVLKARLNTGRVIERGQTLTLFR